MPVHEDLIVLSDCDLSNLVWLIDELQLRLEQERRGSFGQRVISGCQSQALSTSPLEFLQESILRKSSQKEVQL